MTRTRLRAWALSALLLVPGVLLAAPTDAAVAPAQASATDVVSRVSGADRYATSAAISAATFAPGVPVAYVASGTTFPDALSAAPAAGTSGAPLLLTAPTTLPGAIRTELARLKPARIVVIGGTTAVSSGVASSLRSYTSGSISRSFGADRYATSAAISAATFAPGVPVAYVASGTTFPDALSAAPAAGTSGAPLLLTAPTTLPGAIRTELARLKPARIVVIGGTSAVSSGVASSLRSYTSGSISRSSGADRYATSAAISAATFAPGVPVAYVASGTTFPDALSAAPAAGTSGAPLLLTAPTTLPGAIRTELARLKPARIVVIGGTSAVSSGVETGLRSQYLPTSCGTSAVWGSLAACGWPGPSTTGYPSGLTFSKKVSGGLVITTDGTVVDGWDVSGGIQVRAKNVTIRNSRVTLAAGGTSGTGVVNVNPGASATIERTTLDGLNATHACVWHEGTSVRVSGVNCSRVNDGIFMWATKTGADGAGDNFVIEDSWLHDFTTQAANGHVDGIQTEGAKHGVIQHNTIDVSQSQTSAVALWNSRKSVDDVRVDGNLMAGGGFTVYAEDYSPSESNPAGGYSVTNVTITGNVFSTARFGCVGYYGVWFPRGAPTDGWRRSGNVVLETGQRIDAANPTYAGTLCR